MTDSHHQSTKICLFDSCWCGYQHAARPLKEETDNEGGGDDGSGHSELDCGWMVWQQEIWLEKEAAWQAYDFDRLQRAAMEKDAQAAASAKSKQQLRESETLSLELAQPKQFGHSKKVVSQHSNCSANEQQITHAATEETAAWDVTKNITCRMSGASSTTQNTTVDTSENGRQFDLEVTQDEFWADIETDATLTTRQSVAKELPASKKTIWLAASAFVMTVTAMEQQVGPVIKLAQALAHYLNVATEQDTITSITQSLYPNS
ncbi:MAG: hypothetical protein GKR77_00790 [Legionellales bacterium]|nr:hypothetical protein [Legionellales bacterium]